MNTGYAESCRLLFMCRFFDQRPYDLRMSWLDCKRMVESAVSRTTRSIELCSVPVCSGHLKQLCLQYAYDILWLSNCVMQHLYLIRDLPHIDGLPANVAQCGTTTWRHVLVFKWRSSEETFHEETLHGQTNRRNPNPCQRTLLQRRRWLLRPR